MLSSCTQTTPLGRHRLLDMGCEPFLVAATLEAVLAQRLLRTICKSCRVPYEPTESILSQLGLSAHESGTNTSTPGVAVRTAGTPATVAAAVSTSCWT